MGLHVAVRSRKSAGFTLVEVLVVVALIGILAGVMVPEMRGSFEEARLRTTTRKLIQTIAYARSQAITQGAPHRFRVDPAAHQFWIEKQTRPTPTTVSSERVETFGSLVSTYPEGIRIELAPSQAAAAPQQSSSDPFAARQPAGQASRTRASQNPKNTVTFDITGQTQPTDVIIEDTAGFMRLLQINGLTGRVRLIPQP